ncbi:hypothetical protein ASE19_05820 [Nocardioides sp. Root79]|nr:hypothetical protein ASE19_05820 [Nocardioides sp. Root79]KRC73968.1 hypothetical protein ASE20_03395 [Nocardioides sp. Root240]
MDVTIELGAATDVGRVRPHNEDAYLAREHVAAVADGMGGHAAGDVASARAIEALESVVEGEGLRAEDIQTALDRANEAILAEVALAPEKSGMGTTLAGVALIQYGGSPHWIVFNIGDSRVYRIADGQALQLTVDHSEVAELMALGRITAAEAAVHPLRNVITRSLGTTPAPRADLWIFPASPSGDTFVACSDGLTNELDDTTIATIVTGARGPGDAAAELVASAVDAGGRDNITAVVVHGVPKDDDEPSAATAPRPAIEEGRR